MEWIKIERRVYMQSKMSKSFCSNTQDGFAPVQMLTSICGVQRLGLSTVLAEEDRLKENYVDNRITKRVHFFLI